MAVPIGNRRRWAKPSNCSISSSSLLSGILLIFSIFYVVVAMVFFVQHNNNVTASNNKAIDQEKQMDALHRMDASANHHHQQQQQPEQQPGMMEQKPKKVAAAVRPPPHRTEGPPLIHDYEYWKDVAVTLAGRTPDQVIQTLEHEDPFGVRQFERDLVQAESERGAFVDVTDLATLFPCPEKRITLPDQRNRKQGRAFRKSIHQISSMNRTDTAFLFFQHLRKAGGTNFCTLAEHNLHRSNIPSYYCMPDMQWSDNKCAGCLTSYTNDEIVQHMRDKQHLILGNEWDSFDPSRFFYLPAVFATSFRKPLDRALSQFRFECIEDRVSRSITNKRKNGEE
jgi:hypothetical protein